MEALFKEATEARDALLTNLHKAGIPVQLVGMEQDLADFCRSAKFRIGGTDIWIHAKAEGDHATIEIGGTSRRHASTYVKGAKGWNLDAMEKRVRAAIADNEEKRLRRERKIQSSADRHDTYLAKTRQCKAFVEGIADAPVDRLGFHFNGDSIIFTSRDVVLMQKVLDLVKASREAELWGYGTRSGRPQTTLPAWSPPTCANVDTRSRRRETHSSSMAWTCTCAHRSRRSTPSRP